LATALAGASALGCSDERPATKAPPPVDEPAEALAIDAAANEAAEDDTRPVMPYGAPTPPPTPVLADAAPADAGAVDAAAAKKRKKAVDRKMEVKERVPKMPYGAPPPRRRIV
jgi:hypothetical protein